MLMPYGVMEMTPITLKYIRYLCAAQPPKQLGVQTYGTLTNTLNAGMAKLVDARNLKFLAFVVCGFEPRCPHHCCWQVTKGHTSIDQIANGCRFFKLCSLIHEIRSATSSLRGAGAGW